jgi:hypothetical protein
MGWILGSTNLLGHFDSSYTTRLNLKELFSYLENGFFFALFVLIDLN